MAKRIIFTPTEPGNSNLYNEILVDFKWEPGMALSQAQKSVKNLHASALGLEGVDEILEISTRSLNPLGLSLSAFNLELIHNTRRYSVESVYQSSKVFSNGGPYPDLLSSSSLDAKRDSRLKSSGDLVGFKFEGIDWPVSTSPNFYDYLYIRALLENMKRAELLSYDAFSDMAFSQISLKPKIGKSFNCQARSAAIYVSLTKRFEDSEILDWISGAFLQEANVSSQLDLF
jgi:hypothetical protein